MHRVRPLGRPEEPNLCDLIVAVSREDGWPIGSAGSVADARTWLRARTWRDLLVAGQGELVAFAGTYEPSSDDPSLEGWCAGTGLRPHHLRALGGLMVRPANRRLGLGETLVRRRVDLVQASGRTAVLATWSDGPLKGLLPRLGATLVGDSSARDGRPLALWAWLDSR